MFVTAKAQDFITYSRSSIGTYIGSDGLLKTAAVDEPRIEYAADGTVKGLLIEEQRENLITYSEDFTDASWSEGRGSAVLDAVGPDGVTNSAATFTDNGAGGSNTVYIGQNVSVSTSTAYTFSLFAKADQLSDIHIRLIGFTTPAESGVYFDLSGGTVGSAGAGMTGGIEDFGNGWYRCSVTFTTDAADTAGIIRVFLANGSSLSVDLDSTSSALLYGAQFELGSFATSYIPTSGSQQIRSADVASIPVSAFGYNDQAGTVVVEAVLGEDTFAALAALQSTISSATERISFLRTSSTALENVVATAAGLQAQQFEAVAANNTTVKQAMAFTTNSVNSSFNGNIEVEDTSAAMPTTISVLMLGRYSSGIYANGHIRSLKYYPRKVSDTELQTLTT